MYKNKKIVLYSIVIILSQLILVSFNLKVFNSLLEDTNKASQSGELGMLSQQLTKAIFTLQLEQKNNAITQSSLTQLRESSNLFTKTINELTYENLQDAEKFKLNEKNSDFLFKAGKIKREWLVWKDGIDAVLSENGTNELNIELIANKLNAKNVYLLSLTDDLSLANKSHATKSVATINAIQVSAVLLFIISILIFLFVYIRQSEKENLEKVYQNTILSTLNETVFLINTKHKMIDSHFYTSGMPFKKPMNQNDDVVQFFKPYIDEAQCNELKKYLNNLFLYPYDLVALNKLNPVQNFRLSINGHFNFFKVNFTQIINENAVNLVLVKITNFNDHPTSFPTVFRAVLS